MKPSPLKPLVNGLLDENPVFVQAISMCPLLAVTTSAENAIGMGLTTAGVLVCSNAVISLMRNWLPEQVRIPCYLVVIASFVTMIQLLLEGYFPALYNALGLFIPLIVVNCIILARAEAFATKNNVFRAVIDGVGMGLGFTGALLIVGIIREILGAGTLFGHTVLLEGFPRTIIMVLPPGAFLTLGFLMAGINTLRRMAHKAKRR